MSMELMVRAMKMKVGNPLRKLVLLKLADNASDQGECWPSVPYIAEQCEISERSVQNHIQQLVKDGLVRIEKRLADNGLNRSNVYRITLSGSGANAAPYGANPAPRGESPAPGGGAAPAPRISHSFEPVIESVNEPSNVPSDDGTPAQPKKGDYPAEFEKLWAEYPKREGSNPKNKAYQAWNARRKAGVTFESMAAGLQRYVAFCGAKGQVGTSYVMQASRFFGPGLEFNNAWMVSSQPAQSGVKRHSDTAADLEGRNYETRIGWKNNTQEGRQ
ncbi:hypothetical protein D3C79_162670 [compost metagenome]